MNSSTSRIQKNTPYIHVLVKPTGARCNLACRYCFYLSKENLYPEAKFRMSDEMLEEYLRQYLQTTSRRLEPPSYLVGTLLRKCWTSNPSLHVTLMTYRDQITIFIIMSASTIIPMMPFLKRMPTIPNASQLFTHEFCLPIICSHHLHIFPMC